MDITKTERRARQDHQPRVTVTTVGTIPLSAASAFVDLLVAHVAQQERDAREHEAEIQCGCFDG